MMEAVIVSETLEIYVIITQLTARKDYITFVLFVSAIFYNGHGISFEVDLGLLLWRRLTVCDFYILCSWWSSYEGGLCSFLLKNTPLFQLYLVQGLQRSCTIFRLAFAVVLYMKLLYFLITFCGLFWVHCTLLFVIGILFVPTFLVPRKCSRFPESK